MRRVIVESPYAGNIELNLRYLRACMHDCLLRNEAPFASHGLYTQPGVLDDAKPSDREYGIRAGFQWGSVADATVVYTDLGTTAGMQLGIANAVSGGRKVELRTLDADALSQIHVFGPDEMRAAAAALPPVPPASIPMCLWCPLCGTRHLDEGEFATKPHATHACQHCGLTWRPAIVATVGVQFLPGFKT
jgi:hypothetical protein